MLTKKTGIPFAQIYNLPHLNKLLSEREEDIELQDLHYQKRTIDMTINEIYKISFEKINSYELVLFRKECFELGLNDIYHDLLQHCIISSLYNIEALCIEKSYGTPRCHIINTLYKLKIGNRNRFSPKEQTEYINRSEVTYYDKLYNILSTSPSSRKSNITSRDKENKYGYFHNAIGLLKKKHKSKGYSYYCHPSSVSFIADYYELLLKKRIDLTYNTHKTNITSSNNNNKQKYPSYSTGNINRYVNEYISWLDYINNTLTDYSALDDDITKILYYYRNERIFNFRLLEWIFKNRIAYELDKFKEDVINNNSNKKESETNNIKQPIFDNEYWIDLSYFPNCFSIIKWTPLIFNYDTNELICEIHKLEKKFTLMIVSYCNQDLESARKLLRNYIEDLKKTDKKEEWTEWEDLLSQIKEKEKDYLNTKTITKLYANKHKHTLVTATGNKLHLINAYKDELNIKNQKYPLTKNEGNYSKTYSSEIDEYLSKRYNPSWWDFKYEYKKRAFRTIEEFKAHEKYMKQFDEIFLSPNSK